MKFITGEPAVLMRKRLIVADLHLGIETEYWKAGFRIASHMMKIAESLNKLSEASGAKEIVVNGDFKNSIAFPSRREERYIPEFLNRIDRPLIIVKGNHDGGIERFWKDVVPEVKIGSWLITHGHRKAETEKLIIGHNHPCLEIKDRMGSKYREPVWAMGRKGKMRVIVMPAFNPLVGCHPVNQGFQGIAKGMELESVRMLDGMELML